MGYLTEKTFHHSTNRSQAVPASSFYAVEFAINTALRTSYFANLPENRYLHYGLAHRIRRQAHRQEILIIAFQSSLSAARTVHSN